MVSGEEKVIGFGKMVFCLLSIWFSCVEAYSQKAEFSKSIFISKTKDSLPYRLLAPQNIKEKKKYPLIHFLHGSGARGKDNEKHLTAIPKSFTDSLIRLKYPCYILAPQCSARDAWVNFPSFPQSLEATDTPTTAARLTLELVKSLIETEKINPDRIYITGYSLGGEGTFDLISREPNLFAAAVPICPVADTSKASSVKHIPIWVFHGSDDKVNPVEYSQMMVKSLVKAGSKPKYTEYKGVGHKCWDKAYAEPELLPWLFAQRKKKRNK